MCSPAANLGQAQPGAPITLYVRPEYHDGRSLMEDL